MMWYAIATLLMSENIDASCSHFDYDQISGQRFSGSVIQEITGTRVTLGDCERACQLKYKCYGFNFKEEHCQLVDVSSGNLTTDSPYTFYVTCPTPMKYEPSTGHCYLLGPPMTWAETIPYCQSLHRRAHSIEIQSESEQHFAENVSGGEVNIWLGAKKVDEGGQVVIKWLLSNTPAYNTTGYMNWANNEPDGYEQTECIYARRAYNFKWRATTCGRIALVICEFWYN